MTDGSSGPEATDREAVSRWDWMATVQSTPLHSTIKAVCWALFSYASSDGSGIYPSYTSIGLRASAGATTVKDCMSALRLMGLIQQDRAPANRRRPDERTAVHRLIEVPNYQERVERVQRESGKSTLTTKTIKDVLDPKQRSRHTGPVQDRDQAPTEPAHRPRSTGDEAPTDRTEPLHRPRRGRHADQIGPPHRPLNTKEHEQEPSANARSVTDHARVRETDDNNSCQYCGADLLEQFGRFWCGTRCPDSRLPGNHADRLRRGMTA